MKPGSVFAVDHPRGPRTLHIVAASTGSLIMDASGAIYHADDVTRVLG